MKVADIDWDNWQAEMFATLLFIVKKDQVLLIRKKRGLGAGKVNGPGGKIDVGETPMACATKCSGPGPVVFPRRRYAAHPWLYFYRDRL
jgi:hypothetical protein